MGYTTSFKGEFKLNKKLEIDIFLRMNNELRDGEIKYKDDDLEVSGYCQWVPNKSADAIVWDGEEKFYDYIDWLKYLIKVELAPKGYVVNGSVVWSGEEVDDVGTITVKDNFIEVHEKKFVKLMDCPHCGEEILNEVGE